MPGWLLLAGVLDALGSVLQFTAMFYLAVAVVISIKRCGVFLGALLGGLLLREHGVADRVIACGVMVSGVLTFILSKPDDAGAGADRRRRRGGDRPSRPGRRVDGVLCRWRADKVRGPLHLSITKTWTRSLRVDPFPAICCHG